MNTADYGQMARMLMMAPQLVGDVIPFQRRQGLMSGPEMGGRREGHGGGMGHYGSQWRTPEGVSAYEAQSGLRPGTLAPVNPNRGDLRKFPSPELRFHYQSQRNRPLPISKSQRDIDMVSKQWHSKTPNMAKALEKLTPSEVNRLFDAMFPNQVVIDD